MQTYEAWPEAATRPLPRGYLPRSPESTPLHAAVREGLGAYVRWASTTFGGIPRFVERDFERYLDCGVLARGFSRVRCRECGDETNRTLRSDARVEDGTPPVGEKCGCAAGKKEL